MKACITYVTIKSLISRQQSSIILSFNGSLKLFVGGENLRGEMGGPTKKEE